MSAHVHADRDVCIGAGNCVRVLPRVFDQDEQGTVVVLLEKPGDEAHELLERAVIMCPSGAITVSEASPAP